jgi:hypothetical protein
MSTLKPRVIGLRTEIKLNINARNFPDLSSLTMSGILVGAHALDNMTKLTQLVLLYNDRRLMEVYFPHQNFDRLTSLRYLTSDYGLSIPWDKLVNLRALCLKETTSEKSQLKHLTNLQTLDVNFKYNENKTEESEFPFLPKLKSLVYHGSN